MLQSFLPLPAFLIKEFSLSQNLTAFTALFALPAFQNSYFPSSLPVLAPVIRFHKNLTAWTLRASSFRFHIPASIRVKLDKVKSQASLFVRVN